MPRPLALSNGVPRYQQNTPIISEQDIAAARLNNQFTVSGSNATFDLNDVGGAKNAADEFTELIIVFLEVIRFTGAGNNQIEMAGTTDVVLTVGADLTLDLTHSPLRLDGGLKADGTVAFAKGFYVRTGTRGE